MVPLVLEIFIDQSTVFHKCVVEKPRISEKNEHIHLSARTCESMRKHTFSFPCRSAPEMAPQTASTDSPFQVSVFLYGVPKAGRGQECLPAPAGWEKAEFWHGTLHFLHLSLKGRWELSGCSEITAPEWDWKPNEKHLASLKSCGVRRREVMEVWVLFFFFSFLETLEVRTQ